MKKRLGILLGVTAACLLLAICIPYAGGKNKTDVPSDFSLASAEDDKSQTEELADNEVGFEDTQTSGKEETAKQEEATQKEEAAKQEEATQKEEAAEKEEATEKAADEKLEVSAEAKEGNKENESLETISDEDKNWTGFY